MQLGKFYCIFLMYMMSAFIWFIIHMHISLPNSYQPLSLNKIVKGLENLENLNSWLLFAEVKKNLK